MADALSTAAGALLEARDLTKRFEGQIPLIARLAGRRAPLVHAVDKVSFAIRRGETLGLIGESGCGKSTLGRTLLRLHEPTAGRILFAGTDLTALGARAMKAMRRRMQIIFQDPYASLNPRRTVAEIVGLPLRLHGLVEARERRERVAALVERVGLHRGHLGRYPHQFSGGQRQRIGIARALVLNPEFLVCDEPVSALDVSVQAQILELLRILKADLGLTYLFISHDLRAVGYLSDRIAVMYLGRIVEMAETKRLLAAPAHPYTETLLSAVPHVRRARERERIRLSGELPSPFAPPSGCAFHTRCPRASEICRRIAPMPVTLAPGHRVACHLHGDGR